MTVDNTSFGIGSIISAAMNVKKFQTRLQDLPTPLLRELMESAESRFGADTPTAKLIRRIIAEREQREAEGARA